MRLYGLIGYPLGHSFSKKYFSEKFENENIPDCRFENFEIEDIGSFKLILKKKPDLLGCSVTIPHKEKIIPYLEFVSPEATEIGAVNCIKVSNGKASGYNTDWIGLGNSIKPLLQPSHKKALILGTGGAAKAVFYALKKLGLLVKFVSRKPGNGCLLYDQITRATISEYTVVVNCTPLGMPPYEGRFPLIPYQFASTDHIFYDLTYNPEKTAFLRRGEENGAVIKNGLEMLYLQAEAAWGIWNAD